MTDNERKELFAQAVKACREAKGWSIRQLARTAGVDAAYISRIEHAAVLPGAKVVRALAQALDAPELYAYRGFVVPQKETEVRFHKAGDLLHVLERMRQINEVFADRKFAELYKRFPEEDPWRKYLPYAPSALPYIFPPKEEYDWISAFEALGLPPEMIYSFPPIRYELIDIWVSLLDHENQKVFGGNDVKVVYERGYLFGLHQALAILHNVLQENGLFWLLAAFLPPKDCYFLASLYNEFSNGEHKDDVDIDIVPAVKAFIRTYLSLKQEQKEGDKTGGDES